MLLDPYNRSEEQLLSSGDLAAIHNAPDYMLVLHGRAKHSLSVSIATVCTGLSYDEKTLPDELVVTAL